MRSSSITRSRGWLLLVTAVTAYDIYALRRAHLTLSAQFRRTPATVIAWSYLTAHLFGLIPQRLDPLAFVGRALSPENRR